MDNSTNTIPENASGPFIKSDAVIGRGVTVISLIGVAATSVILIATLSNVISRAVFNIALNGAIDLSNVAMVVVAFCALPGVTFYGGHIKVDIVTNKMPRLVQKCIKAFNLAVVALMCAVTAWYTVDKGIHEITTGTSGSSLRIPYYPFYFVISVMFVLTSLCLVYNLVRLIATGDELEEDLFEQNVTEQAGGSEL